MNSVQSCDSAKILDKFSCVERDDHVRYPLSKGWLAHANSQIFGKFLATKSLNLKKLKNSKKCMFLFERP